MDGKAERGREGPGDVGVAMSPSPRGAPNPALYARATLTNGESAGGACELLHADGSARASA